MKAVLAALGLAALITGCDKTDVSAVGEDKALAKPAGCETVKDIRYERGHNSASYQVLCEQDGGMVLYTRNTGDSEWTSISVSQ